MATILSADALEPASHFSDHMVLQRDAKVPVWGKAEAGSEVTVSFAGQRAIGKAAANGEWRVSLKPMAASSKGRMMTVMAGDRKKMIKDVLVGEVWVGSGQSNMAGRTASYAKNDPTLAKVIELAPYPLIRLMQGGPKPKWVLADVKGLNSFSAIMTAFGERLHRELNVPVGMIVGAVGGTPSGAWMPPSIYASSERCKREIAAFATAWDRERAHKQYEAKVAAFEKAAAKAKAAGKKARGRKPRAPANPGETTRGGTVGNLFERYIKSSVGYAIRGVVWDQGEAGSGIQGLGQYTSMTELIRGWREVWGQGEFPFIFVQKPSGGGNAWSTEDQITREAEAFSTLPDLRRIGTGKGRYLYTRLMLDNANAWMVPACDLGPKIHPSNKWGYGNRAAQVALQKAYGREDVKAYGPIYKSHDVKGSTVTVKFSHADGGLAQQHGDKLQGFAVAGADGKWHWADAKISGQDIVRLSCAEVKEPKHVRYAYSQNRRWANLFNKAGLPALAFTTEEVDFAQVSR